MIQQSVQKKNEAYSPINCCSQGASISQILAIALFTGMEILSFNLITNMLNLKSGVMYALMGMFYLSFLVSIIEYIHILVFDPSDPRLSDKNYHDPSVEEKNCEICVSKVAASSHHCQSCQRCVEEFDHHCRFANNCVGKSNYSLFIRLLISIIIHTSSGIGISVWLALALTDAYRWVAVAYGVLNLIIFLQIGALSLFHCCISFCLFKTTFQVFKGDETEPNTRKIYKNSEAAEQSNFNLVKNNNNLVEEASK